MDLVFLLPRHHYLKVLDLKILTRVEGSSPGIAVDKTHICMDLSVEAYRVQDSPRKDNSSP